MVSRDLLPDGAAVGSDRIDDRAARKSMAWAGFGLPGEDVTVGRIDLNDALIRHPQSTVVMRPPARRWSMPASRTATCCWSIGPSRPSTVTS